MKTISSVVGARPNFVKLAPLDRALRRRDGTRPVIVHTGQYYDPSLSETLFRELWIPQPDHNLGVEIGHAHAANRAQRIVDVLCG